MAKAEGMVTRNPALQLFIPRESPRPTHRTMSVDEVKCAFAALPLRERLIFKLAVLAGMRPGEIFALRCGRITETALHIRERVYRGRVDTPKTHKSKRSVALSAIVREDLDKWLTVPSVKDPDAWLFPSENVVTPFPKENAMYRHIRPRLKKVGLGWVTFQVMRRTYSSCMRKLGVDPKVVADLMGHDVDVNLNVYTQTSPDTRLQAVETLGSAFVN